jgi:coenzyme F420-reducing hydrogenase delta subunit
MTQTLTKQISLTAFCCHNALYRSKNLQGKSKAGAPGVHTVEVPCSGKVEPLQILKAFENGADGVLVIACPPQQCMTIEGSRRQARRIARTKDLLAEAGLEPERLMLHMSKGAAADEYAHIISTAEKSIAKFGPATKKRD